MHVVPHKGSLDFSLRRVIKMLQYKLFIVKQREEILKTKEAHGGEHLCKVTSKSLHT
jgi:hypothetical protein